MPHQVPLQAGDPRRVGRYRLTGRLDGIPSDDPIFTGLGPDGAEVCISVLGGYWDAAALDRFAAEAAVAKRVPPFCAARVLDAGLDGDSAYLVSEYVTGRSLLEIVAEYGVVTGPQLEALAIGMATGLSSVHQAGLVHGNFGPQYVLLSENGPPHVVEFGITPPYGSATPSADMLAWAQTVVFAATGRPPGDAADLAILPEGLREPVQQCLDVDPLERPAARAVVQFLLGDRALPAGLLAEGSRRAARGAGWAALQGASAGSGDAGASPHSGRHPALPGTRRQPDSGARSPGGTSGMSRPGHVSPGARHTGSDPGSGAREPAQRRPAGSRRSGRSRVVPWLVAGAAAAIVLIVIFVLHLGQGGNAANLSASTGPGRSGGAGPSATQSASQPPVVPQAFNGIWSGAVSQPPSDTIQVKLTLLGGRSTGSTISYSGAGASCSGDLTPTSVSQTRVVMKVGIVQGQKSCGNLTVTITALSGGNAVMFNASSQGAAAAGRLNRQ